MADSGRQTSESFLLSAILSFSGGLQVAYTYNVRGEVFANAQTGNVVLMSQHFMLREWDEGIHYLFPLMAFALGIFIAENIDHRYKMARRIHWRQIVLLIEIVLLGAVGFLPAQFDMAANMMVSLSCAMQVQSFRKVAGYGYASTMCIGNLRAGTESLAKYFHDGKKETLRKSLHYFGIILIFALGAGFGGVMSQRMGIRTIWISSLLLLVDCMMMRRETI